MAANYYKLKGKVWGGEKDKQNTHSYIRVMAVWLMETKGFQIHPLFPKGKKKKSTKQFAHAIGLYLKCKTWHAGSAELCSEFSRQI